MKNIIRELKNKGVTIKVLQCGEFLIKTWEFKIDTNTLIEMIRLISSNSQVMKNIIRELKNKGVTIILTTHNMHDATELCDRVAFIVDGNIKDIV